MCTCRCHLQSSCYVCLNSMLLSNDFYSFSLPTPCLWVGGVGVLGVGRLGMVFGAGWAWVWWGVLGGGSGRFGRVFGAWAKFGNQSLAIVT